MSPRQWICGGGNLLVQVGTANKVRNIKLGIDPVACDATGYTSSSLWSEGFDTVGTTPPDGWSVTDHLGQGFQWTFQSHLRTGATRPAGRETSPSPTLYRPRRVARTPYSLHQCSALRR